MEKIEKTYGVKSGGSLNILSQFGAIEIQTAEQDKVEIVITKESKSELVAAVEKMLADFELAFEHNDSDVHIRGAFKHGSEHWRKQLNLAKINLQINPQPSVSISSQSHLCGGRFIANNHNNSLTESQRLITDSHFTNA